MTKAKIKAGQISQNNRPFSPSNEREVAENSLPKYLDKVLEQLAIHVKSDTMGVLVWEEKPVIIACRGGVSINELNEIFNSTGFSSSLCDCFKSGFVYNYSNFPVDPLLGKSKGILDTHIIDVGLPNYTYWILVPIHQKDHILGYIFLGRSKGIEFSIQEIQLINSFTEIISEPILKENKYTEERRIASEGEALIGVLQALTSQLELDVVLQLIADEARRLTNTRTALLMLVNGDQLKTVAISGPYSPDVHIGYEIPIDNSNTGASIRLRRPVRVQDAWNNPTVYKSDHLQVRSFISVPLIFESNAIGAIMVADKLTGALGNDDERIVSMFASSAVIAVENARHYRVEQQRRLEADQRRHVAEGLREILAVLNSHQPLQDMLYQISRQSCQLLGCDACAVSHVQSDGSRLLLQASYGIPEELLSIDYYPKGVQLVNQTIQKGKPIVFWIERATEGRICIFTDTFKEYIEFQPKEQVFQTAIAIPLMVDRIPYGAMLLFYHDKRNLSKEEIGLAVTVGDQVVMAIENAQLHLQAEDLARLQERQRIAQALHDSVAQMLFSLGMEVDKVKNTSTIDASFEQSMLTIRRLAARSSYELRSAIFALREGKKKGSGSGVVDLIEEVVAEFRTQSNIAITCIAPPEVPNLLPNVTEAIYRIVRESLSNISKHSNATAVIVTLTLDNHSVHVMIQDDGVGLDKWSGNLDDAERHLHFGVATMRQLTSQAHGQFIIMNGDDQGVLIKASFPISEETKLDG